MLLPAVGCAPSLTRSVSPVPRSPASLRAQEEEKQGSRFLGLGRLLLGSSPKKAAAPGSGDVLMHRTAEDREERTAFLGLGAAD